MRLKSLVPFALLLALAGCGGGSGGAGVPVVDNTTDFAVGDLVGRAAITNPPVTTTSTNVTAVGLKGTFTSLKLRELNPSLSETRFYYNGLSISQKIFSSAADGSDVQQISGNSATDQNPDVSLANGRIAFDSNRDGPRQIYTMKADGTNVVRMTDFPASDSAPSWSPDGTRIAFVSDRSGSPQVYVVNSAFQVTQITNGNYPGLTTVAFSGDGQYIFFNDGATLERAWIPSGGVLVSTHGFAPHNILSIEASPDGQEVAVVYDDTVSNPVLRFGVEGGGKVSLTTGLIIDSADYSPDGKRLVLSAKTDTQFSAARDLYTVNLDGSGLTRATNSPTLKSPVSWGPFTKERILLAGSGGTIGTSGAGIIYSQKGNAITSVLSFEATTPSSVVLSEETGLNSFAPTLLFSIDADNIPKMAYANGNVWKGVRVIGSGTPVLSANGALVGIDAVSGQVVTILPFTGSRATGSKPTARIEGKSQLLTGQFLAAYDANGNNLAPNGASRVRLDANGQVTIEQ